jgi:hypothetical protein
MRWLFSCLISLFALAVIVAPCAAGAADVGQKAPLSDALGQWIKFVENDELKSARQWAAGPDAAGKIEQLWPRLRECHKDYDYRRWIDGPPEGAGPGAKAVGDATTFTLGGHLFGHLHVKWEKSEAGWTIADVFLCR